MKTPRDLLLARHAGAERKLEKISGCVVSGLPGQAQSAAGSWLEWLWPRPFALGALAAAWIVVAAFHLMTPDVEQPAATRPIFFARSTETQAALREQKRLLAELVEPAPPEPADRRPRSAIHPEFYAV